MAAIRSALQQSVFQVDDERLLLFCNVSSENEKKKKKETYLCVTASTQLPVVVKLYNVRAKDEGFYKKESITLRDVRMIDGINPRKPSTTFCIYQGEKKLIFNTATVEEKESFVQELYLIADKYLPIQKPEFVNISIPLLEVPKKSHEIDADEHQTTEEDANYQPITSREEADFLKLLNEFNLNIAEAAEFNSRLTHRLAELDNTNIESIMANEQAVSMLIADLEECEKQMEFVSARLHGYDLVLNQVEESVEIIEEKANLELTERQNLVKLYNDLIAFIELLMKVSPENLELLQRPKFGDAASINLTSEAVRRACDFINAETPHSQLGSYQERLAEIRTALSTFVDTFYSYVSAILEGMRDRIPLGDSLMLPKHSAVYRQLQGFTEIIRSIQQSRRVVYSRLLETYQRSASQIFAEDFESFFRSLRQRTDQLLVSSIDDLRPFADLMELIVAETDIVVQNEQKFLTRFLNIPPSTSGGQLSEEMRSAMRPLFDPLPEFLQQFGRHCATKGHLVVAALFVRLVGLLPRHADPASYFTVLFGNLVVGMKRVFDEQMNTRRDAYLSQKAAKKQRVGATLLVIDDFRQLITDLDRVFGDSDRRTDLDKWAVQLCNAVVESIDAAAAAASGSKIPVTVIRFTNFHELYQTLKGMRRVTALQTACASVQKKYQENMRLYVFDYLGRPMEKLHLFFEQVENAIRAGVRPAEVSFQQQFSRAELKKHISAYPARDVRRNLDALYAKVEKHLGGGDNQLMQVVWRQMQEEFLNQLKNYQSLIERCYPGARIPLECSIEDVLGFFSAIAQQH